MSELEAAWDQVHAANTTGWQVGRPYFHDERRCLEQYADLRIMPMSGVEPAAV